MGNCFNKCLKKKVKAKKDKLLDGDEEGDTKENIAEQNESSLKKQYEERLVEFRVTEGNIKSHHFIKTLPTGGKTINKTKQLRINNELKQLAKQLPVYYTNSIFVRYDQANIDLMQALITGSQATPYANGVFLFDIHLPDTYPTSPPKMNLMTTGGGHVRFNPNLYATGFVCLSLLGTWTGASSETWSSGSTILQVLLSLQSLVMNEDVFYNEPGTIKSANNLKFEQLNAGYCNIVKYCTIKYAMTEVIKKPPEGFEEIVYTHFRLKKNDILAQAHEWLKEAESEQPKGLYEGIVFSHNEQLARLFSVEGNYRTHLLAAVKELEQQLNSKAIEL